MRAIFTLSWGQLDAAEPFLFECQSMDSGRAGTMELTSMIEAKARSPSSAFISWFGNRDRFVDRQFEIEFLDSGVEAFAFTFG